MTEPSLECLSITVEQVGPKLEVRAGITAQDLSPEDLRILADEMEKFQHTIDGKDKP